MSSDAGGLARISSQPMLGGGEKAKRARNAVWCQLLIPFTDPAAHGGGVHVRQMEAHNRAETLKRPTA